MSCLREHGALTMAKEKPKVQRHNMAVLDRPRALFAPPGESYNDVIIKLAIEERG
jgi:hypothetical protein